MNKNKVEEIKRQIIKMRELLKKNAPATFESFKFRKLKELKIKQPDGQQRLP